MQILERIWAAAPAAITPFCHGSTIIELPDGDLLAAWFGGTWEAQTDTGIWLARRRVGAPDWERPELVIEPKGHAHGNPVLALEPGGELLLFYFRNYGEWCIGGKSFFTTSTDGGRTWSTERQLSDQMGLLTKNKAWISPSGSILLPVYDECTWQSGVAISEDQGQSWSVSTPVGQGTGIDMIQGALAPDRSGGLHMFMRTRSAKVYDTISTDGGRSWGAPVALTLDNPNSGIDALTLVDGRLLMVYNPSRKVAQDILNPAERDYRYPLCVALSDDDGTTWQTALTLESEPGEYSYPAVTQGSRGLIHITYTYHRQGIRHVVLNV